MDLLYYIATFVFEIKIILEESFLMINHFYDYVIITPSWTLAYTTKKEDTYQTVNEYISQIQNFSPLTSANTIDGLPFHANNDAS